MLKTLQKYLSELNLKIIIIFYAIWLFTGFSFGISSIIDSGLPNIENRLKEIVELPIPEQILYDPIHFITEQIQNADKSLNEQPKNFLNKIVVFFMEALPDIKTIFFLSPFFILYTILATSFSGWLRTKKGIRAPYTRKTFHLFIFTMASILQFTGGLPTVVLFGCIVSLAVLYAIYRGDKFPFYEAMARPTDSPHRTFFIVVPLITTALGGLTANFFFGEFSYIGYLVAGWGDAVGEPVGTRWGKHKYRIPSLLGVSATRSLEGSIAVMIVSILVAFIGFTANQVELTTALLVSAACGTFGAIVEAISNHGLDNFTIQVAAAGTAYFFFI